VVNASPWLPLVGGRGCGVWGWGGLAGGAAGRASYCSPAIRAFLGVAKPSMGVEQAVSRIGAACHSTLSSGNSDCSLLRRA
jgi:hypothetical protein